MSTTQLLRYPLTREKILASCHGLTSAGSISPSGGAPALGETTDTFGTASCLVSAIATRRCDNRGTTPAMSARTNRAAPIKTSQRDPCCPNVNLPVPKDCSFGPIDRGLLIVVPFIR